MSLISTILEMGYDVGKDHVEGHSYFADGPLIGLVVGLVCTEIAKFCHIVIDPALQLKIVSVATGLGAALDKKSGLIKAKPPVNDDHNISSLS